MTYLLRAAFMYMKNTIRVGKSWNLPLRKWDPSILVKTFWGNRIDRMNRYTFIKGVYLEWLTGGGPPRPTVVISEQSPRIQQLFSIWGRMSQLLVSIHWSSEEEGYRRINELAGEKEGKEAKASSFHVLSIVEGGPPTWNIPPVVKLTPKNSSLSYSFLHGRSSKL